MKQEEKIEGICLQETPYLEKGKIMKIFTPYDGLLTLFGRKHHPSPFCLGEWVIRKGKGELYTLIEGSLLNPFLDLRNSYMALKSAGKIGQNLLRSQLPDKSAPILYQLLLRYFQHIGQFRSPAILSTSFQLKLLMHEGLFVPESPTPPTFNQQEWDTIFRLSRAPTFSLLKQISVPPDLETKVNQFFEERMHD